jgi:ATP-dependent Clp protease ATP-binding subunit ClpA
VHHAVDGSPTRDHRGSSACQRYITDRQLPDKAIDLIDEAAIAHPHGDRLQARRDGSSWSVVCRQLKIEREAVKKDETRLRPPSSWNCSSSRA